MTRSQLYASILKKKSFLCVGLDPDLNRMPNSLLNLDDPIFEFNRAIIEATKDYCVAYKPNLAFYEAHGPPGWESLRKTMSIIPRDMFTIADAKRGDIGNTSRLYAQTFFEQFDFDAITIAPYMGQDSVQPFLEFPGKWVILLALTSNQGAADFQLMETSKGDKLYQQVLSVSKTWGGDDRMMYVVGATQAEAMKSIRKIVPNHFLLVPGVGTQGGDLHTVSRWGLNRQCGLLVNASRSILYASQGEDFAQAASNEASRLQAEMKEILLKYHLKS